MTERPYRFILQAYHPEYACPAFEAIFTVDRLEELQALLGPDALTDPDIELLYWLDPADLAAISQHFGVPFAAADREVAVRKWQGLREPPYLVHTGFELPLMLDGRKKLARFSEEYPPDRHGWEDVFDRFVTQGLLHKEVDVVKFKEPHRLSNGRVLAGLRTVYYTPKGEEWRIEAFRLIERAQAKGGWNDTLERLEGMLYGYEDWQNDWWADYRRRRGSQFGTMLVYVALAPSELAAVELSGFRALPPLDRSLPAISSFESRLEDDEWRRLRHAFDGGTIVRFRVKAHAFLNLSANPRERAHLLRADQIKAVNEVLLEKIEVVTEEAGRRARR